MAQAPRYLWQRSTWPSLRFDDAVIARDLIQARQQQGKLLGQAKAIGLTELDQVVKDIWVEDALATAAIEGEKLDLSAVRSSVMRRLGLAVTERSNRHVDGLVEVMEDATARFDSPLDGDRLCRWQSALFPGGTAGIRRIEVGRFRTSSEPMQIVGGPIGKEVVCYTAPSSSRVKSEMRRFLAWFEKTRVGSNESKGRGRIDGVVRAAIAHLWFETVHPFEDGNGRIGRAIVDLALAQDTGSAARIYSVSRQFMQERKAYYKALGDAQHGDTDITAWVLWFLRQFIQSCIASEAAISSAIAKSKFWTSRAHRPLTDRQRKVVQRLLDAGPEGFAGGLSAEKYSNLTKVSKATTTRDLAELLQHEWVFATGQGKATRYWVNVPEWRNERRYGRSGTSVDARGLNSRCAKKNPPDRRVFSLPS